jgi:hypothetical protein
MAYGIQINTMFGLQPISNQIVPKLVASVPFSFSRDVPSGSFAAPGGVTSDNGIVFSRNGGVKVTISGSTIIWESVLLGTSGSSFIEVLKK